MRDEVAMYNKAESGRRVTRILVVDADPESLQRYSNILGNGLNPCQEPDSEAPSLPEAGGADAVHSCSVCLCESADDAVRAVAETVEQDQRFAIAFIDVVTMRGADIARSIQAVDPTVSIVLVFDPEQLTVQSLATDVSPLLPVNYWQKPLRPLETQQLVSTLSAKRLAEQHLHKARASVQQLLSAAPVVIYRCSPDRRSGLTYISENVREHFGYDADACLSDASFWIDNIHPEDRPRALELLAPSAQPGTVSAQYRFRTASGGYRWISDQARLLSDDQGAATEIVGCWMDVTERKKAEDRIRYLAYFDDLTGLPNRAFLSELLEHSIAAARRHGRRLAVLFMDVDHFKRINDSLGHDAGDKLLRELAKRLSSCLRSSDAIFRPNPDSEQESLHGAQTISRLGGDEFVIVLNEISGPDDAALTAQRIARALSAPMILAHNEVTITPSIGISIFPEHGSTAEELLKNADSALYKSKDNGRNTVSFFTENLNETTARRFSIESKLRKALDRDEFMLYYQPIVDVRTMGVIGVEALIRWRQPDEGLISPSEFIPIAEDNGLIIPIDRWVYGEATRQLQRWMLQGLPRMKVSVNVSAVQFKANTLIESLSRALDGSGLDPRCLQIELTENLLISDTDASIRVLDDAKALGATICVDDFGTGYSSLSYLKRFPLHALKVPRCFVRDITVDLNDAAIVSATVALAHNVGLRTIGEGIENARQLAVLKMQGCDEAQGYFFAPPMPPSTFVEWHRSWCHARSLDAGRNSATCATMAS